MTLPLKPSHGGFLRTIDCAKFIREFLAGSGPYGSAVINPVEGSPQSDVFHYYKDALRQTTAMDRATSSEEKMAKLEKRSIDPNKIQAGYLKQLSRLPYKSRGCRFHSFIVYFATLKRLGWVEESGHRELSAFQGNFPPGPPRIFYRLTSAGRTASDNDWANPQRALYG